MRAGKSFPIMNTRPVFFVVDEGSPTFSSNGNRKNDLHDILLIFPMEASTLKLELLEVIRFEVDEKKIPFIPITSRYNYVDNTCT